MQVAKKKVNCLNFGAHISPPAIKLPETAASFFASMNKEGPEAAKRLQLRISKLIDLSKLRVRKQEEKSIKCQRTKARLLAIRAPGATRFMNATKVFGIGD